MEEAPDPQKILRLARQTMSSAERRQKYSRIDFMGPSFWYRAQLEFFAGGASGVHQRMLYGGNQSGKTLCGSAEVSWHASGLYPSWWVGFRFQKPITIWVIGESTAVVRENLQAKLAGGLGDDYGTGTIPLEALPRKPVMISGGSGGIDVMFVQHFTDGKPDGISKIFFKSFEQGREKLQSATVDFNWIDERPSEPIYNELLARTFASGGHIIVTYTSVGPGAAAGVTYKFLSEPSADRASFRITGAEVRHISAERREELDANLPEHEKQARLEGIPQLGSGPIFPVALLSTLVKEFNYERDLPGDCRHVVGIDLGFGHPAAACWIAWSPSALHCWVIDSFRMEQRTIRDHAARIIQMCRGLKIPVAWPHDAHQHDRGSGSTFKDMYKACNLDMMATHAQNQDGSNAVDPALTEIGDAMYDGRITIRPCNAELLEELRHYHRDEHFKIVKMHEDLISSFRYGHMMRRKGKELDACPGVGYGPTRFAHQVPHQPRQGQLAANVNFDVFTGRAFGDF
jgi:phage terminase large subunit-like protein